MPITQTKIPLSDEWATPKWLYDHFDREFRFTLDACARPWNAKHPQFIAPWIDGLKQAWPAETVWCNPPYSDIATWMEKAANEALFNGATVVCLVPCTPDRHWWRNNVEMRGAEVRHLTRSLLPTGRVHFEREDGTSGRAPFPSCLVIYRPRSA